MFSKMTTVLLASLALTVPLALGSPAMAYCKPVQAKAAHRYSVFGYAPGSSDEQLYGRYTTRSHAEDAAADAAGNGWNNVRIHKHQ